VTARLTNYKIEAIPELVDITSMNGMVDRTYESGIITYQVTLTYVSDVPINAEDIPQILGEERQSQSDVLVKKRKKAPKKKTASKKSQRTEEIRITNPIQSLELD